MQRRGTEPPEKPWRLRLYEVIFEAETPAGRTFDILLLVAVLTSVGVVLLDSVAGFHARYGFVLWELEWLFTLLFTIEYVLRLIAVRHPLRYAVSFFGIVDLVSILPTYLSLLFPGSQSLLVIRILRLLRAFRIFKLTTFVGQGEILRQALWSSRQKIIVFLSAVFAVVTIIGATMYLIEGPARGFTSIPMGMYWAVITLTTVGFGDIVPHTTIGRFLASVVTLLGWGTIAVPTGIVTTELTQAIRHHSVSNEACPGCGRSGHDIDARYCKFCGHALH